MKFLFGKNPVEKSPVLIETVSIADNGMQGLYEILRVCMDDFDQHILSLEQFRGDLFPWNGFFKESIILPSRLLTEFPTAFYQVRIGRVDGIQPRAVFRRRTRFRLHGGIRFPQSGQEFVHAGHHPRNLGRESSDLCLSFKYFGKTIEHMSGDRPVLILSQLRESTFAISCFFVERFIKRMEMNAFFGENTCCSSFFQPYHQRVELPFAISCAMTAIMAYIERFISFGGRGHRRLQLVVINIIQAGIHGILGQAGPDGQEYGKEHR